MSEFKLKETSHDFKTVDHKEILKESVFSATFKTKEGIKSNTSEDVSNNPNEYAQRKITDKVKETSRVSKRSSKKIIVNKYKNYKQKKKNIKTTQSLNEQRRINKGIKDNSKRMFKTSSNMTKKAKESNTVIHMMNAKKNYERKKHVVKAAKSSAKRARQAAKTTAKTVYAVGKTIVKAIRSVPFVGWIFGGIIMLLLIVILCSSLIFMDNSTVLSENESSPVSEEVLQYRMLTIKYASQYGIEEYVKLIEAVMMQESGGKGKDPMQSSECGYNTKYPNKPDSIKDPEYSIDCGVHQLADCLKEAKSSSPTDMKHIYLALQGYNYGNGYISWAINNHNGYSESNAKVFSDNMKKKYNVKTYGDPKYVPHVMRYYKLGNNNIVKIAKQEVGNVNGNKYWSWYGYKTRVEWCACFVSWCGDQAGLINNEQMPKFSNCQNEGIPWFKNHNQWIGKNSMPKPGYIIFFDWENDGISDHVGIVEKVEGNTFYTIEGNSSNECKNNSYDISFNYIYGYGVIK